MRFIFVADAFLDNGVLGGGELNNEELMSLLQSKGHEVLKINSHVLNKQTIDENIDSSWIISNFVHLNQECIQRFISGVKYVIYEHDHKYLKTRNPSVYENYLAPEEDIINKDFYSNAIAVFCQSNKHASVVKQNLNLDNIVSVSGNLWREETLDMISDLSKLKKEEKCSIMMSPIEHKNTVDAIRYCKVKKLDYKIINPCAYKQFLTELSKNDTLVFFPKTLETLCRVVVEAKMLGCKIITNSNVSALDEDWFKSSSEEIINKARQMREDIPSMVVSKFM